MTVNSNSAMSPASLIAAAFKCDDVVAKQTTTGIQTMAAAIMAHHEQNLSARRAPMKAIAEKGAAYDDFRASFMALKNDGVPVIQPRMKKEDASVDIVQRANTRNASQMVLMNKGFALAFALDNCGVSLASYTANSGVFSVPVSSLIANDDAAVGSLLKIANAGGRVALDGKTYAITNNDKFTNIKAFPDRVLKVAGYKRPKTVAAPVVAPSNGASDTTTSGGAAASDVRRDPNTWSLDALLTGAADLLNRAADTIADGKSNGDSSGKGEPVEQVAWSELPEKMRNAIDAVLYFATECKQVDAINMSKAA